MFSLEGLLNLFFFWILVKTFCDLVDNFWPKCQALILCVQRIFLGEIFWEASERNYLVLEFMRKFSKFLADKFKQVCRSCILQVQREIWRIKGFSKKNFKNFRTFDHKTSANFVRNAFFLCRESFSTNSYLIEKTLNSKIFSHIWREKIHRVELSALYVTTGLVLGKRVANSAIRSWFRFWTKQHWVFVLKILATLSKQHSTCPEGQILKNFFREIKKVFWMFLYLVPNFCGHFSKSFRQAFWICTINFQRKKVKEEALVQILGSILNFYSEQQVSGFLEERFWPSFHY